MAACNGPECRKNIRDGQRRITLDVTVAWGDDDLRADWQGEYTFHSYGCLADWAEEKAADHDGRVVQEGKS